MEQNYTTVREQAEYGLDTVAPERMVEVSLRDLLFVKQTLGLCVNFFHQRGHWPNVEDVHRFMAEGGFDLLSEAYYGKLRDVWPTDIAEGFIESRFDNPISPYYYKPSDKGTV